LESIGDESNIDNFESRRFYVQMFEMKLLGYILDEEDYEVVPTINRAIATLEVDERRIYNDVIFEPIKRGNQVVYNFVFKPKADNQFTFTALYDVSFTELTNIENLTRIIITVNDSVVFDGTVLSTSLILFANDVVKVKVYKGFVTLGGFTLIGNTTS
jgi:hypothetical protein